jgi:dTDP-L-rhamnose 4-epimerase
VKVLVTGGAGFVGSHVVDQLLALGHDVRVVDVLHAAAHRSRPAYLDERAEYLWGDLADRDVAARAVDGVDAVSHQASMVGLGVDFGDVTAYAHHNDLATAALLRALHDRGYRGRLVLASSMVVYGEGQYECETHGRVVVGPRTPADLAAGRYEPRCPRCGAEVVAVPITEDVPPDPRNVYAATKLHQEHLCRAFAHEHPGVVFTALRYHNVYGPRMPRDTPYAGVASIFRSAVARGERPRVLEDGAQVRDFVHVHDVARANVLALTNADAVPGALNIASGEPRTVLELAVAIVAGVRGAGGASGAEQPDVVGGGRPGDVRHVMASPARARSALGFEPTVRFDAGMREFATAALR